MDGWSDERMNRWMDECEWMNELPSLVTESIVAILPHAVEVGLMLPVVAVRKLTVLVEPR